MNRMTTGKSLIRQGVHVGVIIAVMAMIIPTKNVLYAYTNDEYRQLISANVEGDPYIADSQWSRISSDGSNVSFLSQAIDPSHGVPLTQDSTYQSGDDLFVRVFATQKTYILNSDGTGTQVLLGANNSQNKAFVNQSSTKAVFIGQERTPDGATRYAVYQKYIQTGELLKLAPSGADVDGAAALITEANKDISLAVVRVSFEVPGSGWGLPGWKIFNTLTRDVQSLPIDEDSFVSGMSDDGRYVLYTKSELVTESQSTYLASVVYRYDTVEQTHTLISKQLDGSSARGEWPVMNSDGTKVAFVSSSQNIVQGAENPYRKLFIYDVLEDSVMLASTNGSNQSANHEVSFPVMSDDGRRVAFFSRATNLVTGDTAVNDAFAKDLQTGIVIRLTNDSYQFSSPSLSITSDGKYVSFTQVETAYGKQIYRYDLDEYIGPLAPPTDVIAQSPSRGIFMQWQRPTGAESYRIYMDGLHIATSTETHFNVNDPLYLGIVSGNTYSFQIAAVRDGIESAKTNAVDILVDRDPPSISNLVGSPLRVKNGEPINITYAVSDLLSPILGGEVYLDQLITPLDNVSYANGMMTYTFVPIDLPKGSHTLYFNARDSLGNISDPQPLTIEIQNGRYNR